MQYLQRVLRSFLDKNALEKITIFLGLMGQMATYIQAIKIFHLQSAYSVSLPANIISFISMVGWLAYGIAERVAPLIIVNIIGLIGSACVIGAILIYGI